MTTVIIPALNEEKTIGAIVSRLTQVINADVANVIVVIDPASTDDIIPVMMEICATNYHVQWAFSPEHGKGQCVNYGMQAMVNDRETEVCFCDADVTLSHMAVRDLFCPLDIRDGQRVIVPRAPSVDELLKASKDSGLTFRADAWQWVSGIRRVRRDLIPSDLYGYLMETQINQSVAKADLDTEFCYAPGVVSPLRFTPQRVADLKAHGDYGKKMGIL